MVKSILENRIKDISSWLQQHIYQFGRYYTSDNLCMNATGEPLNPAYFIKYIQQKIHEIYVS